MKSALYMALILAPGLLLAAAQQAPVLSCANYTEGPQGFSRSVNIVYRLSPVNTTADWSSVIQARPHGAEFWNASSVVNASGPDGQSRDMYGVIGANEEPNCVDCALRCSQRYDLRARTLRVIGGINITNVSNWSQTVTCQTNPCACATNATGAESSRDYRCRGCLRASGSSGNVSACLMCVNKVKDSAGVSGCFSCMKYKSTALVNACLHCVSRGIAPWACTGYCANATSNNFIMGTCTRCLASLQRENRDLWPCRNCLAIADGDGKRFQSCVNCLDPSRGVDSWSCGMCTAKGRNATARAQCYNCLYQNPGRAWGCINSHTSG